MTLYFVLESINVSRSYELYSTKLNKFIEIVFQKFFHVLQICNNRLGCIESEKETQWPLLLCIGS